MTTIDAPPRAELVGRAAELVPLIREHAPWQEQNRVLHEEVVRALVDAGLFRMRVPTRHGGHEADVRTTCEVLAELGRGDGSVGWTVATLTIGSWLVGLFPDEVQEEVFADPSVRVCGSVSPGGVLVPTEGGAVLNGEWHFNTGAPHSQWDVHSVLLATEDGGYVPATAVVPMSDLTVGDDWHTSGLRATGSVTTAAKDVFVPQARILPMLPVLMEGRHLSARNADAPTWKVPFMPFAAAVASAPALGMARAAWEAFFERLPGRKITYTNYDEQAAAPLTHLQVAEAAVKTDEAEFHLRRGADRLDAAVAAGQPLDVLGRVAARMDAGALCQRAKEAVEVLATASGGSSIYTDRPIQRIERDVQAITLNGIMQPTTNAETYGRVLCGLEPNTQFI
ncbi:acyl-CoA dehydrogenase family protein [Actinosynnema sp.]|uniref:acyl-CoA dehydrogenase family protein n=1 Tax=Actinosynnema sp. TaxID=1872144 RepID=UPI003F86B0B5